MEAANVNRINSLHSSAGRATLGRALMAAPKTHPSIVGRRSGRSRIDSTLHSFKWPPVNRTLVKRNTVLVMSEPCVEGLQIWIECSTDA